MNKRINIIDDCYTKFGLKHTSKSQNTIPDDIRFRNYLVMTPKEKMNQPKVSSFQGGTIVHEVVQKVLCHNAKLKDVVIEYQNKYVSFKGIDTKDSLKFNFILQNLESISTNHLENIKAVKDKKWEDEKEYTHWDDQGRIGTYFLAYVDLVGSKYFGDIKNVFGTLTKTKNGHSYSKKKCPVVPFHSDCLQIALYNQLLPKHKPFLTYASDNDKVLFTEDNCNELQPNNIKKYYDELITYQRCWEKKLQLADGDLKTLALLVRPDFSEIRKGGFWWKGVDPDIVKRFRGYYE